MVVDADDGTENIRFAGTLFTLVRHYLTKGLTGGATSFC